jgi:hypothetical protein
VAGILIGSSIAGNVAEPVAAAQADGFTLGGGGFRDRSSRSRFAAPTLARASTTSGRSLRRNAARPRPDQGRRCNTADIVDALDAAREDLSAAREQAESTAEAAAQSRDRAAREADQLADAIGLQRRLADGVDQRLDAALAEADALATLDAELSAQIKAREAALAARVAESRRQAELAARRSGPAVGGGAGAPAELVRASTCNEVIEGAELPWCCRCPR